MDSGERKFENSGSHKGSDRKREHLSDGGIAGRGTHHGVCQSPVLYPYHCSLYDHAHATGYTPPATRISAGLHP